MQRAIIGTDNPLFSALQKPGGLVEIKTKPKLTDAEFYHFCADNRDLRIELAKNGTLLLYSLLSLESGHRQCHLLGQLFNWFHSNKKGKIFSSSTLFTLPDGSIRAADGSWVSDEKIAAMPETERKKFARLVPDFVIEVRSTSDRLGKLKQKMADCWIKNGVRFAWLIDPIAEKTWIYRADQPVEELAGFDRSLFGEDVCPGFEFELSRLRI